MKIFREALSSAAILLFTILSFSSCTSGAKINGVVSDAPDSKLVLRKLDVNKYVLLDTVKTDSHGAFSYKVPVQKGQPEFVYLFSGDNRIGSMILQSGEKVRLVTDLRGNCSVEGSPESEKLLSVEHDEAVFSNNFAATSARLNDLDPASDAAQELRRDLTKQYISYYRDRVQYVMTNSKSLTVIPVLYQVVGDDLPVFGQSTDAIHFRNCCDSLKTVYPDSKYVKALEEEAQRRHNILDINTRLSNTEVRGYPEIELPDQKGNKIKLSDVEKKLTVVYFWASEDNDQKMLNFEVMKPMYEKYKDKGLEIYAISLDTDKTQWATTVRTQGLGWVNVCDGKGSSCPAVGLFNVTSIPNVFIIKDGSLQVEDTVKDAEGLSKYVAAQLR